MSARAELRIHRAGALVDGIEVEGPNMIEVFWAARAEVGRVCPGRFVEWRHLGRGLYDYHVDRFRFVLRIVHDGLGA